MAHQTHQLAASLPQFASQFLAADAKGSHDWQVIQWSTIDPADIMPDAVERPVELEDDPGPRANRFASRTEVLRYSKPYVRRRHPQAKETNHWGVWRWVEDGVVRYQSVAPIIKSLDYGRTSKRSTTNDVPSGERAADHSATRSGSAVREVRSEVYSPMVRVSAEANRRLREISLEDKLPLQSVLDAAVDEYYRNWYFRKSDAEYIALRQNDELWAQELAERKAWDATLMDGIDSNETWCPDRMAVITSTKEQARG